jgi:hypothetical protein
MKPGDVTMGNLMLRLKNIMQWEYSEFFWACHTKFEGKQKSQQTVPRTFHMNIPYKRPLSRYSASPPLLHARIPWPTLGRVPPSLYFIKTIILVPSRAQRGGGGNHHQNGASCLSRGQRRRQEHAVGSCKATECDSLTWLTADWQTNRLNDILLPNCITSWQKLHISAVVRSTAQW